jgi:ABC-type polysaccharide/polyol phosphate export permease
MFNKDNLGFGVLLGLFAPIVSFFGYYLWKFGQFTLGDFMHALQTNKQLVTALTIPILLLNIVLFTYYINTKKDKTAKGIFAVTLVFALTSVLFKYFA